MIGDRCRICLGEGRVARVSDTGGKVHVVTCPLCVRGVTVLGPHEMLRPTASPATDGWKIWRPGDILSQNDIRRLEGMI